MKCPPTTVNDKVGPQPMSRSLGLCNKKIKSAFLYMRQDHTSSLGWSSGLDWNLTYYGLAQSGRGPSELANGALDWLSSSPIRLCSLFLTENVLVSRVELKFLNKKKRVELNLLKKGMVQLKTERKDKYKNPRFRGWSMD